jgi:hypothetical protein
MTKLHKTFYLTYNNSWLIEFRKTFSNFISNFWKEVITFTHELNLIKKVNNIHETRTNFQIIDLNSWFSKYKIISDVFLLNNFYFSFSLKNFRIIA